MRDDRLAREIARHKANSVRNRIACSCQWNANVDGLVVRSGAGRLWHRPQWVRAACDIRLSDGYRYGSRTSYVAWCGRFVGRNGGGDAVASVPSDDMVLCGKCDKKARAEGIPDLAIPMIGGGCAAWDGQRFA